MTVGLRSKRRKLTTHSVALGNRSRGKLVLFFLVSVLCHYLLYFALQDLELTVPQSFEAVEIKLVEVPLAELSQETTPARVLASRQTRGDPTGVLREPFAWEMTEDFQQTNSPRPRVAALLEPEAPQWEHALLTQARAPEQAITVPDEVPPENRAPYELTEPAMEKLQPREQEARPEPVWLPEEPSAAEFQEDAAERVQKMQEPAEHILETTLASLPAMEKPQPREQEARPEPVWLPEEPSAAEFQEDAAERVQKVQGRAEPIFEASLASPVFRNARPRVESPPRTVEPLAPDETPVAVQSPQPLVVSAAPEPALPRELIVERIVKSVEVEVSTTRIRHRTEVAVGKLLSIAEAEVASSYASITASAPGATGADGGKLSVFISVRNEGTAPLLIREAAGLFDSSSPQFGALAGWEDADLATSGSFLAPAYDKNDKPGYPRVARERGYEGKVVLKVKVLANGRVGEVTLQQPSGHNMLDRSAIKAVWGWQFYPAKKNGVPVDHWTIITVEFRLIEG